MKKRIRKKLHLGEFQELCFDLHLKLENKENPEQLESVTNAVLALLTKYEWICGGTIEDLSIAETMPQSGMPEKREAFLAEVRQIPGITSVEATGFEDAWN